MEGVAQVTNWTCPQCGEVLHGQVHSCPGPTISFERTQGVSVGKLHLGPGKVWFEGEAEESAQIFFDAFISLVEASHRPLLDQIDNLQEVIAQVENMLGRSHDDL
jgi:hypothetical protein